MPYVNFENGDSLLEIRNKLNEAIAANEQAAANALSRANHTGTQAKSTITDLESDLSGLQAGIDAINALLGDEAGDGNTAVDTLREALTILQNFSEGTDVAQLITDAQASAVEADGKADQAQNTANSKIGSTGSPTSVSNVWVGSQVQYDALTPDANTLYFIQ